MPSSTWDAPEELPDVPIQIRTYPGQIGILGLTGPRAEVDARSQTTWQKCKPRLVDLSLWFFNLTAFIACAVMFLGQAESFWELGASSPELILLGASVVSLCALSILGMWGTRTKHRTGLRAYAFMLLVLMLGQISIVWELGNNLDSTFVDRFASVISSLCRVESYRSKDDGPRIVFYYSADRFVQQGSGSWSGSGDGSQAGLTLDDDISLVQQLCMCTDLDVPRHCIKEWIHAQWFWASVFIGGLLGLEGSCAILAWSYVDRLDAVKLQTLRRIQRVKAGNRGLQWNMLSARMKMNLGLGDELQDKVRREARMLTDTWYFEATVLFASVVMFVVLALQSRTVPPDQALTSTLNIGEMFVTLFLTVDVSVQIMVCMTPAQRRKIPKQPWVLLDIAALVSSWLYLLYSKTRLFSIGRVLRVLRPLRTLRMLSEIAVIIDTVVEALPLFFQACFLISFLQTVFALICMSLWSGGLNYECAATGSSVPPQFGSNSSNTTYLWSIRDKFKCPNAVDCSKSADAAELTWCSAIAPPRFIRSEAFGFTGFDNFVQAMLTMFVQMTGDGGMQDIPLALEHAGVVMGGFGWTLMMVAQLVLTLLALNLFLAVCCAVFDDVHEKVFNQHSRIIARGEGFKKGSFSPTGTKSGGMLALMKEITVATQQAISATEEKSDEAREKMMSSEQKHVDYINGIKDNDWTKRSRHPYLGWYRNTARDIAVNPIFESVVNYMVLVNSLVLMSSHHGMSAKWEATMVVIESICLLFYWLEFLLKIFGFGFHVYLKSNTHRLDFFILVCSSAGFLASAVTVVQRILPGTFPGYDLLGRGLHSLTSIRLVRMLRALQMSRWVYSHRQMRALFETVFKSWESVVLIGLFSLFSLITFAVVSMHLLGGCLGNDATLADYPRTNVETVSSSFAVAVHYLTGESWSGVMYFYMENSDLPKYATAMYFVIQYVWMRCLLFSLFVAVLLVNFAVDEDEKLPRQKLKFDREEAHKTAHGMKHGSAIVRAIENASFTDEVKDQKPTSLDILTAANLADPYKPEDGVADPARCSFNRFDISDPLRLFCARVESSPYFEQAVMWCVMGSCIITAFESPEMIDEYGLYFDLFTAGLLVLFYAQMTIRMVVHGVANKSGPTLPYVRNPLNRLDIFVVVAMTMTYILPDHRALRLLRVMVPLLVLLRNDSLRTLVQTFALSLPAVGAILGLLGILFAVFGIIGVEYFGGRLYRCVYADRIYDQIPGVANRTECELREDAVWRNPPWNFDNIFYAAAALYYMCINSGWLVIMESTLDITDVDLTPSFNSSEGFWWYYAFFHITFSLFLMNLFIGVLSSAFSTQSGSNLITTHQRRWIRILAMLRSFQPADTGIDRPEVGVRLWKYRQKMWDLAENERVEQCWSAVIVFNILILMLDHYPADDAWVSFLEIANLLCLFAFTVELVLKVGAYSIFGYLQDGWHQIDMLVVVGSWSTRLLGVKSGVGVLRAVRTVRVLLLVKQLPSLMALMNTVVACMRPAVDIAAMSFLIFYLYGIIGMKLFGDAPTDLPYYNDETNFRSFFSTLRLLFQQVTGQDMKTIVYDLDSAGYGYFVPFVFLGSFFFLIVFICTNLFIVTVLDNFANLCSLDDAGLTTDEMAAFAESWHDLTYGAIWKVGPNETGIDISDEIVESLQADQEALSKLFQEKHEREADVRLRRFAELKSKYPPAPYFEEHDPLFQGWLRLPNIVAKITKGLLQLNDMRYFWIDSKVAEEGSRTHLCLNWYADGTSERDLDSLHTSGTLKIERVKIVNVRTELPPVKLIHQKTAHERALEHGATLVDGKVNKISAALSGRSWLVSLANAQDGHPNNVMAASFRLEYFDSTLAEEDTTSSRGPTIPRWIELAKEEGLSPLQARLRACIAVGIQIPANRAGCYACEAEDYCDLWPFFSQVLEKLHRVDLNKAHKDDEDKVAQNIAEGIIPYAEVYRWHGNAEKQIKKRWDPTCVFHEDLPRSAHLDISEFGMKHVQMSLSVSRNLVGFNLVAAMTPQERTTMEDLVVRALDPLMKSSDWGGRYVSLTPGHPQEITNHEHRELIQEGLMYSSAQQSPEMVAGGLADHWPYGRGCYISADEKTVVWVGYEDHLKFHSMHRSETVMNNVLDLLYRTVENFLTSRSIEFQHQPDKCGYVTTSPEKSGTGMQLTAKLKLPKLTVDGTADSIRRVIEEHNLEVAVVDNGDNDADAAWGHFDLMKNTDFDDDGCIQLSVTRTFGVMEAGVVCSMYIALKRLQQAENATESAFGGNANCATAIVEKVLARSRRKAKRARQIVELAQVEAEKAAAEVERLGRHAAELAQEQARQAMAAAQAAAVEAQTAARDMDLMDGAAPAIDTSHFLDTAAMNPLAIVLDVERVDAPSVKAPKDGEATSRLVLIAESQEQQAAWLRALKWLEAGCVEDARVVRKDPRMYAGGIPPRPLTEFEWAKLKANVGLLDMPFCSIRTLLHMLQHRHVLGVTKAFDRDFMLWVTFQLELYTFQTAATDFAQRMSGIERAIEACDGCNFTKALQTMCLIKAGRLNSLTFRKQYEAFQSESEYVAVRIIQAVVGAWVVLQRFERGSSDGSKRKYPRHPFWQHHPNIYRRAVLACRDQRLRTLGLLLKLVRRQKPMMEAANDIMKELESNGTPSSPKLTTLRGLASKAKHKGASALGLSVPSPDRDYTDKDFDHDFADREESVATLEASPAATSRAIVAGAANGIADDAAANAAADAALSLLSFDVEEHITNPIDSANVVPLGEGGGDAMTPTGDMV